MSKTQQAEADPIDVERVSSELPEGFKVVATPMAGLGTYYKISHSDFEEAAIIHPKTLQTAAGILRAFDPNLLRKKIAAETKPSPASVTETKVVEPVTVPEPVSPAPSATVLKEPTPKKTRAPGKKTQKAEAAPAPVAEAPTPVAEEPKRRGRPPATPAATAQTGQETTLEPWQQNLESNVLWEDLVNLTLVDVALDSKKANGVLGAASEHPGAKIAKAYSIKIDGEDFGYVLPINEDKWVINAPKLIEGSGTSNHKGLVPAVQRLKILHKFR